MTWTAGVTFIGAATLASAQPLSAASFQPAPVDADLACLIATSLLAGHKDPTTTTAAGTAALFFTGKLFGRDPHIDLKEEMLRVTKSFDRAELPATLQRCGGEMQLRSEKLMAAGKYLTSQGF